MIKTQTKEENKFMKRILPYYFQFLTENPHTLLVRFLGDEHYCIFDGSCCSVVVVVVAAVYSLHFLLLLIEFGFIRHVSSEDVSSPSKSPLRDYVQCLRLS